MATYELDGQDKTVEVEASHQQWFDPTLLDIEPPLDAVLTGLPTALIDVGDAFKSNLTAARHGAALPHYILFGNYLMEARRRVYFEVLDHLYQQEQPVATHEAAEDIRSRADEQAMAVYSSGDYLKSEAVRTLINLPVLYRHGVIGLSAPLALRQATTEIWTAFEVLASDLFVAATDANPTLLTRVQSDAGLAGALRVKRSDLADPAQWPAICEDLHFNQLGGMSSAYAALLPGNAAVQKVLADAKLNTLMQRRHILVHKAGKVDQTYIDKSHEVLPLGSALQVNPSYVAESIILVRDSGITLLNEVAKSV